MGWVYDGFMVGRLEVNFCNVLKIVEFIFLVILFIDELDKVFVGGVGFGDFDGGIFSCIFGSFFIWMQEKIFFVFVMVMVNWVDCLLGEFFCKGWFDEIFFVDLFFFEEWEVIFCIYFYKWCKDIFCFDLGELVCIFDGFFGVEIEQAIVVVMYEVFV